ncbi:MAG: hypothetical protein ACXQTR_01220 [Candidatus Methanospirareceae archaeon]
MNKSDKNNMERLRAEYEGSGEEVKVNQANIIHLLLTARYSSAA